MPEITSSFTPPLYLRSSRIQTITPSLFRSPKTVEPRRELLELSDGDFLELEWHNEHAPSLVIINHGLEGSTQSGYVRGLVRALTAAGHAVLAWNMRGCGTRNRLPTWYHSGQSSDLRTVVAHALEHHSGELSIVGISVGGNILLKYLGEENSRVSPRVRSAVAVSVPMDLKGSAAVLAHPRNRIYMQHLLKPLRARIREKASRFPHLFDTAGLDAIRTFREFDTRYTAPMHGFSSVDEYWDRSSSLHFLPAITVPTLVVSSRDDPFLSPECFPFEIAREHPHLLLETPRFGGHVGFITSLNLAQTWLDSRVVTFLRTGT